MTPWFQSSLTPLRWIRDLCMHPTARIPWVRKQMVLSLAGVKDGLLSNRPLPAPPPTAKRST